ncbi:MAG: hypothetical protein ACREVO_02570 [Steroidobacteraceae bacterium]
MSENLLERDSDSVVAHSKTDLHGGAFVQVDLRRQQGPRPLEEQRSARGEAADSDGWFIAGKRPTEAGLAAFWLDIKITAGTNSKSETTRFVRVAFDGMRERLGPLHEESYVLVHAADGDAYGYGGRTQNGRWAAAHPG